MSHLDVSAYGINIQFTCRVCARAHILIKNGLLRIVPVSLKDKFGSL